VASTAVTRFRPLLAALVKPWRKIRSPTKMEAARRDRVLVGGDGDRRHVSVLDLLAEVGEQKALEQILHVGLRHVAVDAAAGVEVDHDALLALAAGVDRVAGDGLDLPPKSL
jgi:hypothetical protein